MMAKEAEQNPHWSSVREAGTLGGIKFLVWVHRVLGRSVFSFVLYPVMVYFLLARPVARRSSRDFLSTHYRFFPSEWPRRRPGMIDVFRHFFAFGESILDKLLAWSKDLNEEEFEIGNLALLEEFLEDERGQLIIGSHIGNLEYCRGFVQRYKQKIINILVYDQHAANFVEMMQELSPESRLNVYQVDALDIPTMLALKAKIEQGEWLFIAGDRTPLSGERRTVCVRFLDRIASLPIGPYILAKALACPVKLMFSYRNGRKVFFDIVAFSDRVEFSRKSREEELQALAQRYANELEHQLKSAPMQWFNFYPYWTGD